VQIDDKATSGIAAGGRFYQIRPQPDYSIWQYTGKPCTGNHCPGWLKIDDNQTSQAIVAGASTVYLIRKDPAASIWQCTGPACKGKRCSGWVKLDNNPDTASIVAGPQVFPKVF
jgi:hypothetical protein